MKQSSVEIIFSRSRKFKLTSELIKWHMGTPFCHVCLKIYSPSYDRTLIYEASAGHVHAQRFESWSRENKVLYTYALNLSEERKTKVIQYAIDHLEKPYGMITLLGMFLQDLFGLSTRLGIDGAKSFICSEFTFFCLKDELTQMAVVSGKDLATLQDYVDPKEVFQILKDSGRLQKGDPSGRTEKSK